MFPIPLQTRSLAVQKTEEGELDDEAEWIFQNVFSKHPVSKQVWTPSLEYNVTLLYGHPELWTIL